MSQFSLSFVPNLQRSTVSAQRHTNQATWKQHADYLQREGAQRAQERGLGWDARGDVDLVQRLEAWRCTGEESMWKIVVSPENSQGLDLREHVVALMQKMEHDLGQRLDWCAIEHRNTDHHHVHVLVRGTAQDGAPAKLNTHYLRTEFQAYSRELATDEIGWRSEREIQAGLFKLARTFNKTSLDTELNRIARRRSRLVDLDRAPPAMRPALEARLNYLAGYNLAEHTEKGWVVPQGFGTVLRNIGLQHNKQASRARGRITPSQPDLPIVIQPLGRGEQVTGVLIDAGRERDGAKTPWALLETSQGTLRYLAGEALQPVADARAAKTLRSGCTVALAGEAPEPLKFITPKEMEKTYGKETRYTNLEMARRTQEIPLFERRNPTLERVPASEADSGLRDLPVIELVRDGNRLDLLLHADERRSVAAGGRPDSSVRPARDVKSQNGRLPGVLGMGEHADRSGAAGRKTSRDDGRRRGLQVSGRRRNPDSRTSGRAARRQEGHGRRVGEARSQGRPARVGSLTVLAPGRGDDAAQAAAWHLAYNPAAAPAATGAAGFAGRVTQRLTQGVPPLERLIDYDGQRLGKALAHIPDGIVVHCLDDRARVWPRDGMPSVLAGEVVALGGDGKVRAYVATPDGVLPKEALDTQIFAEVRTTGKISGLQPRGEQERINHRNELAARYQAQSRTRALELLAAGVLHVTPDGNAGFTEKWRQAYVNERKGAALSPLPEAPAAAKYQGIVREVGVLTRQGQRGIALDTPAGSVVVPTSLTRAQSGQAVEMERTDTGWGLRKIVRQDTVKQVTDQVKRLHREVEVQHLPHKHKKRSRSRSDQER